MAPIVLERRLRQAARKRGLKGKRAQAYIYGSKAMQQWRKKKRKRSR